MATAKKSSSRKPAGPARAKQVPVRIVATQRTPRPAAPAPVSAPATRHAEPVQKRTPAKQRPQKDGDRRMLMRVGVAVVAAVIFFLWIGYARQTLSTTQGESQTFFSRIFHDVAGVFKKFGNKTPEMTNEERQLNELRNSVFPQIDTNGNGYEFTTADNTNTNANRNQNVNASTNTSVNGVEAQ